jgi:hypothetical protein
MRLISIILVIVFVFSIKALAQAPYVPYRVFVELKAGLHWEKQKLSDPGGRLSKTPMLSLATGINLGMYLNDGRSTLSLELDNVTVGNSFIFDSVLSAYGAGRGFNRLSTMYTYQLPLVLKNKKPKLSVFGKIGPSLTFLGAPKGSTGLIATVFYNNSDDTVAFNITDHKLNRPVYFGLTLGAGILYTPIPRLRFSYSIYPSWNLTSNDVIIQDIRYRFFNENTINKARALSSGTTYSQAFSMGYAFANTQQRKKEIEQKKRLYTPTQWARRRNWTLIFNTSHTYPSIRLTDPAGHLTHTPVKRLTFGTQVAHRIASKWLIGTGFETVPFQLDTRIASVIGGGGSQVKDGLQIPVFGEYQLLKTAGRIKFEVLGRGGIVLGFQRKVITTLDLSSPESTYLQPDYFSKLETRDTPASSFFGTIAGVSTNLSVSKTIFLTGYLQYRWVLNANVFHRSRARYQVRDAQAPFYNAELTTNGSSFLPGFGIGFRL